LDINNDNNKNNFENDYRNSNSKLRTSLITTSFTNFRASETKANLFTLFLKNVFNIPFITGFVAIILTLIPFIRNQAKDSGSIISNYLIGIKIKFNDYDLKLN
jgi:hypothetical protein